MIKNFIFSVFDLFKYKKPKKLGIINFLKIIFSRIRYQPLIFLNGEIIEKKCSDSIIDSRKKIDFLEIPKNLKGKTFLDIGCAEGFFILEANKRGALKVMGCDILKSRIVICKILLKNWNFEKNTHVENIGLFDLSSKWRSDIVTCLSVTHHLHGNYKHDTWKILSENLNYKHELENIIQTMKKISDLTNKMAIIEYCYEYSECKPEQIDYELLAKELNKRKIFKLFKFIRLSASSKTKDRVVYHGFN